MPDRHRAKYVFECAIGQLGLSSSIASPWLAPRHQHALWDLKAPTPSPHLDSMIAALLLVGLHAGYLPARRASQVRPHTRPPLRIETGQRRILMYFDSIRLRRSGWFPP